MCGGSLVKMTRVKDGGLIFRYGCPNCRGYSFFVQTVVIAQAGEIWTKEGEECGGKPNENVQGESEDGVVRSADDV